MSEEPAPEPELRELWLSSLDEDLAKPKAPSTGDPFPLVPPYREPAIIGWWHDTPRAYKVIGAIGVFLIFVFIRFTVDDAFISWRYGLMFARHLRWNYNPAPFPRVEAYTNFLYAVLSIIPAFLHIPVELFFKLVGFAVLGGYLYAIRRVRLPRSQKIALLALALCNPAFILHLFSGLETVSFALLIALVFSMVYRHGALTRGGYLAAFLLALSRPEGIVFAGVAMLWSLIITRDRRQFLGLLVVGWLWAVYWVLRWQYFGYFFPNTYYVKSGSRGPFVTQLFNVLNGLLPAIVLIVLVALVATTVRRDSRPIWRAWGNAQDATPAVLALTSAVVVLGVYHSSSLAQNFVNRFQWQLLFPVAVVALARPLWRAARPTEADEDAPAVEARAAPGRDLWAMAALVIAAVVSGVDAPSRFGHQLVVAAAVLVIAIAVVLRFGFNLTRATILASVGLVVLVSSAPMSEYMAWIAYRSRLQYAHQAMGQAINAAPFNGSVAIGDIGVLPFKIHQPVIDLDGLANPAVAHGTFSVRDVQSSNLDLVIALSSSQGSQTYEPATIGQAVVYPWMQQQGFGSHVGAPFATGYWLNWWARPGVATPELTDALNKAEHQAEVENLKPDTTIFADHLFDFPFLTNGN